MRRLLEHPLPALAARAVLGFLLVAASISKAADPALFASAIGAYRILEMPWTMVAATFLPWLELLAGLGLLLGLRIRACALLAALMLGVFSLGAASALLRGLDISCGCFTQDPAAARLGWGKLVENSLLILLSLFLLFSGNRTFCLEPREDGG
ncbi:MAG: MauE/DoxX family redox-associated membrane protein [Bacteroidota bacterium]